MHNLRLTLLKIKAVILFTLLISSMSASAVVTYQSISSDLLVNKYPGIGNDIYWQGGANDIEIAAFPDGTPIPGSNTIGSSTFGINVDLLGNTNFSFQKSELTFNSNLVIGDNEYANVTAQSEFFNFQDGLFPETQVLNPNDRSFTTVNANNTASFNLFTQTDRFTAESNTVAGYYLNAGQDPESIFSDASLFAGLDPFFNGVDLVDITQQGVVDQFNFLINDVVDPDWQSLSIYYWRSEVTDIGSLEPSSFSNTSGSFVSYDSGAVPVTAVPEPSTYMLLGLGMMTLVGFSRKRSKVCNF